MKFFKLTLSITLIVTILSSNTIIAAPFFTTSQFQTQNNDVEIEVLENGYFLETTIINNSSTMPLSTVARATTKYITKTKTTSLKNSSGKVLWSVSIKATFSYNGKTSSCTSYSHSTTCPAKTWQIKSCSSKKSGNSATATAIAVHSDGIQSQSITKSVTITCDSTGKVS